MKLSTGLFIFVLSFLLNISADAQNARLQVIHNCPDTIVDTIDVYINDTLFISGFAFQNAMPYIDIPAAASFDLTITVAGQGDTTNPIFRKSFILKADSAYAIILSGQVGNTGANGFDLRKYNGQETATNQGSAEVSVKFIHGSYDAPAFDIYELQITAGKIIPFLNFGQDSGYIDLDATDLTFQLKTQTSAVLGEFDAGFIPFQDSAIIVLASGFYDTTGAAGISPLGLIAVLPTGAVITLTPVLISPARVQFIHNCAATDASVVDVWINAGPQPLIDNFTFRTATPFMNVAAGIQFDISICQSGSIDTTAALFRQTFILESNKTYIIIASGTVGSGTYNPAAPFTLDVIPDAREISDIPTDVDIMFWHGSTDAPYMDIVETQMGVGTFVDNISYENYKGYVSVPPQDYDLTIRDSSGTTDVSTYDANLASYTGQAITILASGFLNPANNNNGPDFGLWLATASGGNLIPLSIIIGTDELNNEKEFTLYPNPAIEKISLNGELMESYKIYNMNGSIVKEGQFQKRIAQNIDIKNLNSGIYLIQFISGKNQFIKRFSKL